MAASFRYVEVIPNNYLEDDTQKTNIFPMGGLKTHQVLGDTCFEDSCKMHHDIIHSEIFLGVEPIYIIFSLPGNVQLSCSYGVISVDASRGADWLCFRMVSEHWTFAKCINFWGMNKISM